MLGLIGMELVPLLYGIAYLVHSIRKRRWKQTTAVGVLLLLSLGTVGILLWEFFAVP